MPRVQARSACPRDVLSTIPSRVPSRRSDSRRAARPRRAASSTFTLGELAAAVGASPFRLLTAFQKCFGDTPASYHRKLRLTLALDEAKRRGQPISTIADEFGFAGASSFSHAYRRSFGHSPLWRKSAR